MSQAIINPFVHTVPIPTPGLAVEAGTFTKVVTPTTLQSVAVGFQPKALVIWGEQLTTSDIDSNASGSGFQGFVDDSGGNRCMSGNNRNNVTPVESSKNMSATHAIQFLDFFSLDAEAIVTLTASGFDISWTTQNAIASRIHFIAYGGDDITGTQVLDLNKLSTVVPATQNIATNADVQNIVEGNGVLFMGYSGGSIGSFGNDMSPGIGIATKAAPSLQNGMVAWMDNRGANPSIPRQVHKDAQIVHNIRASDGLLRDEGVFGGFTASGFDIDWGPATTSTGPRLIFLIIKGGQWETGNETARTTTGTKATTTVFQPKGLFTLSVKRTADGDAPEDLSANIGAADGTNHSSASTTDESAVIPTNIGIMSSVTKLVRYHNPSNQAVLTEADLDSFNATDFTLDWTTVDGNAYKFIWLVCGSE